MHVPLFPMVSLIYVFRRTTLTRKGELHLNLERENGPQIHSNCCKVGNELDTEEAFHNSVADVRVG
jgi:hypothetical protein